MNSRWIPLLLVFLVGLHLPKAFTLLYPVSYTHLRAHETLRYLVCRLESNLPFAATAFALDSTGIQPLV